MGISIVDPALRFEAVRLPRKECDSTLEPNLRIFRDPALLPPVSRARARDRYQPYSYADAKVCQRLTDLVCSMSNTAQN